MTTFHGLSVEEGTGLLMPSEGLYLNRLCIKLNNFVEYFPFKARSFLARYSKSEQEKD